MGAVRRLKGLDAIRDATVTATPAIHVLVLDGVPRTGLSIEEIARVSGHTVNRIRTEIRNGTIRHARGGARIVIPVSELAVIDKWADISP